VQGAAVGARYGRSLATLIDLDRFVLYDQLRLPTPQTLADEQQRNKHLMNLLRGESVDGSFAYAAPEPAPQVTITAVPAAGPTGSIVVGAPPANTGTGP
jgi:hypothetical protein